MVSVNVSVTWVPFINGVPESCGIYYGWSFCYGFFCVWGMMDSLSRFKAALSKQFSFKKFLWSYCSEWHLKNSRVFFQRPVVLTCRTGRMTFQRKLIKPISLSIPSPLILSTNLWISTRFILKPLHTTTTKESTTACFIRKNTFFVKQSLFIFIVLLLWLGFYLLN